MPVQKEGALLQLELKGMETTKDIVVDFNSRLNIITGDNGLGKSFILECAWWALTHGWTAGQIYPRDQKKVKPQINHKISDSSGAVQSTKSFYDWKQQNWVIQGDQEKVIPGLVIYARVDGAFAIWDPARTSAINNSPNISEALVLSREAIWEGVRSEDKHRPQSIFNGLITDWVYWQTSKSESFEILKKVLKRLSPPDLEHGDLGVLEPGEIVRIPGESRPIPTIKHPYGEVPVIHTSAAVKRIIAFAYLIVWTWEEHKTASKLMHEPPQTKMVVIADEIEAHLHPQWQRVILPAIAGISGDLSKELDIQFIITTHSPLVMASIEPTFNEATDKIFHLNLHREKANEVEINLENPSFEKRGSADSWLTSSIFELKQPRSIDSEKALEDAKALQKQDHPDKAAISEVSGRLIDLLPAHDSFWVRWNNFAEKNGVKL